MLAGRLVQAGANIDLIVSSGSSMVKVPDMVGKNYAEAAEKLENMGFDML